MSYIGVRIPTNYRRLLYWVLALSWFTGIAFFIFSRFITVEGEFGPEKHPWQFPTLMIHGAAAFLMMMTFSVVLVNHIAATWRLNRLRGFGLSVASILLFQVITAWLLYYLSSDEWRTLFANLHAFVGLCFPLVLFVHIATGRKERREMQARVDARKAERRAAKI